MNWGLAVKTKSKHLLFGLEKKSGKNSNPILVDVIGKFSLTVIVYKLTLITIVRNEQK